MSSDRQRALSCLMRSTSSRSTAGIGLAQGVQSLAGMWKPGPSPGFPYELINAPTVLRIHLENLPVIAQLIVSSFCACKQNGSAIERVMTRRSLKGDETIADLVAVQPSS